MYTREEAKIINENLKKRRIGKTIKLPKELEIKLDSRQRN
jgi:hypothetical protein